ncbi:MutS domain V [Caldanaerovirga acetigignens]|uniref:MutS domain V n=1 Tax=Caldanaerovirga acetigignens TaxID=447595 RepID=A0A1M7JYV3_9FIRM|nr:hypothetical protein [Caldanaerovirga acetigignens]SHM58206.1 MutS domain V [Caldanaerovirga acetigignens]
MKVYLMFKDRNFDLQQKLPKNEQVLLQDLELETLFDAMALGDNFIFEVARKVILSGFNNDTDTVLYRQDILKDCLKNPSVIRSIYEIAKETIENEKKNYWGLFSKYPDFILQRSKDVLKMFLEMLRKLRIIAEENESKFESEGFKALFAMLKKEIDDDFFTEAQNHLRELNFDEGMLISAELGKGNKGINYILRKSQEKNQSLIKRFFAKKVPVYTFYISGRDESGARAISELKERGINLVANALAQSVDHILNFFKVLKTELTFYIGCLNLYEQLSQIGEPTSFPVPVDTDERKLSFKELYDVCLALTVKHRIVGNSLNLDDKDLVIITGANQGGKSTFIRSIGLAQLMMQSGMFVPAEFFSSNIFDGLFTHFKRKEDETMKSGKLDEELARMSEIVDDITLNSMLLLNESFSATNEREGSQIAEEIISALLEKRIKVFFVTHLYEFANSFYNKKLKNAIFLRAQRKSDGTRTYKIIEGKPLETSFSRDLYKKIFGENEGENELI